MRHARRIYDMGSVLIAQDYVGQHSELARLLDIAGISYSTGKNTELELNIDIIKYEPEFVIFNASRLGFNAVQKIFAKARSRAFIPRFINIYTYEDPEEIKLLFELGIHDNIAFPYRPEGIIRAIRRMNELRPHDLSEFICMVSDRLDEILQKLNPSKKQRGNLYIRDAVILVLFNYPFQTNLHGCIYRRIADKYSTTVKSVEHSIRISIESCWKSGSKDYLRKCIGSTIVDCRRPTNNSFIMSLAHLILRDNSDYFDAYINQIMNNTSSELHI